MTRSHMGNDIYIVGGARTPMAEYNGRLKDLSALGLGAIAAHAAMERTNVAPADGDHVVCGEVLQISAVAGYGVGQVGLSVGILTEVPALTVELLCGSGIEAAVSGGEMVHAGEADIVLAGGVERMREAPH